MVFKFSKWFEPQPELRTTAVCLRDSRDISISNETKLGNVGTEERAEAILAQTSDGGLIPHGP